MSVWLIIRSQTTLVNHSIDLWYQSFCFTSLFIFPMSEQIELGAAGAIAGANIFVFTTVYAFFGYFVGREEEWDWSSGDFWPPSSWLKLMFYFCLRAYTFVQSYRRQYVVWMSVLHSALHVHIHTSKCIKQILSMNCKCVKLSIFLIQIILNILFILLKKLVHQWVGQIKYYSITSTTMWRLRLNLASVCSKWMQNKILKKDHESQSNLQFWSWNDKCLVEFAGLCSGRSKGKDLRRHRHLQTPMTVFVLVAREDPSH